MNTFENIIMRTEQLMNRSINIDSMEGLGREYNMEAKSLMDTLVELAERRNSYPQHINTEYATDDNIKKMNKYYIWFEGLNHLPPVERVVC
jgi:hypothetical protein